MASHMLQIHDLLVAPALFFSVLCSDFPFKQTGISLGVWKTEFWALFNFLTPKVV
jgi:hypothetical protein